MTFTCMSQIRGERFYESTACISPQPAAAMPDNGTWSRRLDGETRTGIPLSGRKARMLRVGMWGNPALASPRAAVELFYGFIGTPDQDRKQHPHHRPHFVKALTGLVEGLNIDKYPEVVTLERLVRELYKAVGASIPIVDAVEMDTVTDRRILPIQLCSRGDKQSATDHVTVDT